jgi:AraC family transcriptional regulator, transcriptional activator of pobA
MDEELIIANPQTDALAFKIYSITSSTFFLQDMEAHFYSILLVVHGKGILHCDLKSQSFCENTLMRFPIYQRFSLQTERDFKGYLLQLDADFFWNHRHRTDVPCKHALFGQPGEPLDVLKEDEFKKLLFPLELMQKEFDNEALCQYELMISYAEIFLIRASRIITGIKLDEKLRKKSEPQLLRRLIAAIEKYYSTRHSPTEYAKLLNVTVKTLNRITKSQLNKTVTHLIAGRIVTEAKRELCLSTKAVKEIAAMLGFNDEAYFSRFFKRHTRMSPGIYRKTVNPD